MIHTHQASTTPTQADSKLPFPKYTYADGILDVAYEEIAGAKANCFKAYYTEKITEEIYDLAYQYFHADYHKVGRVPYEDLEALVVRYAEQNKNKIYQIGELEIVC